MNKAKHHARQHPTGISGVLASALVVIASKLGVDLSPTEAVSIVAAVIALVSYFSPREIA